MGTYFKDLANAFISTFKGMGVTLKHFFMKPVTVHYPDEHLPIADAYLGKHELDQPGCIGCSQCAKVCPVECIDIDLERHGKVLEWKSFKVDYNYCMFCGLCVETCPTEVLRMTKEYDLSEYDRTDCVLELTSYTGLRPEDIEAIEKAKKLKAEKAAKKKAEEAAKAKEADGKADADGKDDAGDEKKPEEKK